MPLDAGTRLGPYEVVAPIGDPSYERYKASDTRSSRFVALKVLSATFSHPELKARLERDARTLSSLNHPRISAVVEVAHHDPSTDFLVSELVEGQTLAEQLSVGHIDLNETLRLAIAIADSLDQAHRRGIVHGGLNPSVVMLAATGPKLLDFGIHSVMPGAEAVSSLSRATTQTTISSLSGVPTSAAPYMAPEQFAGAPVDPRTDIYSLGALLYEMVCDKPAFQEKTQALLIAAVQTVDPEPVSMVQPGAPPELDYVISRCLHKDPRHRFQTASDVLSELQWIARGAMPGESLSQTSSTRRLRDRAVWIALGVTSILAVALAPSVLARLEPAPEREEVRFVARDLPAGNAPITISPDGRWLTATLNTSQLFGVSLDSVATQVLIEGQPFQPFWSADGRSIAYFESGQLKRLEIGGGPPQIICEAPKMFAAGTWNADGVILFSGDGRIQRVLAAGGQPAAITTLDQTKKETEHTFPVFLPDGRRFLYLAVSAAAGESAIYVGSLDSPERTRLFASESKAIYAAPGYLLFSRGDTVFAQAFDADALTLSGEPIRVASGVTMSIAPTSALSRSIGRSAMFAVSQTGVLAYRAAPTSTGSSTATAGPPEEQRALFWFDRNGQRTGPVGPTAGYAGLDLSPDGRRVAFHRHEGLGGDSWILDLAESRVQRLTFDTTQDNSSPIWSRDGARIAFSSRRNNKWGLYVKSADGTGAEELLVDTADARTSPMSWTPDDKQLVYFHNLGGGDIWVVPTSGDKKPIKLLGTPSAEVFPHLSPDGKWLAYMSDETGRQEIYVRPFPDGPGKWQVSTDGGVFPRWRADGRELFFFFGAMFSADIRVEGSSIRPGVPRRLFGLGDPSANHFAYHRFAVTADGQRFLISQSGPAGRGGGGGIAEALAAAADQAPAPTGLSGNPVTVILNWTQLLKQR